MGKLSKATGSGLVLIVLMLFLAACTSGGQAGLKNNKSPLFHYTVYTDDPGTQLFTVRLDCAGWSEETITLKIPAWSPGYYQIMNYAREISDLKATDAKGRELPVTNPATGTWEVDIHKGKPFTVAYNVKATRRFVVNNYLDSTRWYIVPSATFMYPDGRTDLPVKLTVNLPEYWSNIATGLKQVDGNPGVFHAPDFDILYDCPLLIGNLEELTPFLVNGIPHRFIGFQPGEFDRELFMSNLEKVVKAAVEIIGDIPYDEYTFIAIGPGNGGIEHLNNTTVSFNGSRLNNRDAMISMMSFLAHEYFHHYNVKRIRPLELGPFDYENGSRTNLLWVSEGFTSYYEHHILARAGLITEQEFYGRLARIITNHENKPGRHHQSLVQASYNTWRDGPFGNMGPEAGKTISFYEKGACVGLILDLAIRNATGGEKSLDDVMRLLYYRYYLELNRGVTDAEFQAACETIAGTTLNKEFEYVYTTREIDYDLYLSYAGLKINTATDASTGRRIFSITAKENSSPEELLIQNGFVSLPGGTSF